jgi:hypothetical protein
MSNSSREEGCKCNQIVNFERDAWYPPFLPEVWFGDDLTQFRLGLYNEDKGMRIRALEMAAQYNLGVIDKYSIALSICKYIY